MRYTTTFVFVASLITTVPNPAFAQRPVNVSFGGGYTRPNSEVQDHLGDGYNVNFGVQFNVTPVIGIEGVYSFNGLGQKRLSIPVSVSPTDASIPTDFFADMNMQYG